MDQLERFIEKNRRAFDDTNPDPRLWEGIEARLPRKEARRFPIWKITSIAAVGLVLLLSGVIVGLRVNSGNDFNTTAEYIEFKEAEQYYNGLLEQRVSALANFAYDSEVDSDLDELQSVYEDLTTELEDGFEPNKSDIIQAMIQNYQTRIQLLERVIERMDQSEDLIERSEDETTKL